MKIIFNIVIAFWMAAASLAHAAFDPSKQVGDTNAMPISLFAGDNPSTDAAGRIRVGEPHGLFEDLRTDSIGSLQWEDAASGVGSASSYNANESTVTLSIGTGNGDYLYRQSKYIPYIPGHSQLAKMTFVFGAGVPNVAKRVGLFDDMDGMYVQQSGSDLSVCIRTSTSGSPVNTCYSQANWNLDTMNPTLGRNPSGIRLDATKAQLLVIDFLWQGVGRVRYGFNIDGKTYYVHQILNANSQSVPFIAHPTLPARYEIRNLAASAGGSLKQICVSVESEGGHEVPGIEFAASNGVAIRAITTRSPILAIRLANAFNSKPNRKIARLLHHTYLVKTNDAMCELIHEHGVTADAGGAWVSVDADSAVEVNAGITSVTASKQHVVDINYLSATVGQASQTVSSDISYLSDHAIITQNAASNVSEYFVVYCTSFTGTANVAAELNWLEEK